MAYANQKERDLALNLNYTIVEDNKHGTRFYKGTRNVWATKEGWQTADLVNDYYVKHKMFDNLSDALNREL